MTTASTKRLAQLILFSVLVFCLLYFVVRLFIHHGNSTTPFRLEDALRGVDSPSSINRLSEPETIKALTSIAKTLTDKCALVFLYELVHHDFKALSDDHGSFIFSDEPPIPYSLLSDMPEQERDKHLSLMANYTLLNMLAVDLQVAALDAKQNGWRIKKSNREHLIMCLEEAHRRRLYPSEVITHLRKSGYSAELASLYWGMMKISNETNSGSAADLLDKTVEKVNQQYIDPHSGRMLVVTAKGSLEWRPATRAEKKAVVSFERIWRGIEDAHPRMDDPSTWDATELNEPKQAFIALPPDVRTACRDYIVVRHRWNLQDMLDRWIWEASQR